MGDLDRGRMSFQLSAATPSSDPVGFSLSGPFAMQGDGLPVFDLRYQRLLGPETDESEISSTGSAMFVKTGDQVVEVPPATASHLRLGDDGGGFADLGLAGWVDGAHEATSGDRTTITGTVDVADLLGDVARVLAQTEGRTAPRLDAKQAAALRRLVRSSAIEVVLEGDDPLPRSVRATVDFGGRVPSELRQALGRYAAASLELTMQLRHLDTKLTVQPPR
ncbi:MAG: hypothetical protein QOD30_1300 [Actinomycetota bacterium]|nr:hypothetical protein [Actinomycetota bacterium]